MVCPSGGHGTGAVTALMAPNCIDWVTAFHGAAYAGGTDHDSPSRLHPSGVAQAAQNPTDAAGTITRRALPGCPRACD